ncbi:HypC/HybG/HupF family hydrogenase formation chaperone [Methanococcus maripaludis]|jgi:hydrogenase expression/formation protein HypC|uniref:Hydrogenase expression/formation protein (HUPF/HYPC) n=7 Tax=Methanococcus maripaludis TaxID=39152 RepID=Q6LXM0_METMP|nr:HypC/HybG/HupF family hydrogenase formation chaperone [Methanococcus maripaludis]MDK2928516.1 hydrogenase expression/formation protein HypC [Methanococcus sp.]ABO34579.1 hydrogenase assembly chaperone hypC/hupF [Methanococcus maripaludis C5]AEK20351.1 hydrogenase assembly chaperone hypC/hupF [Methanococcus maripaludis X1]AVB76887.1 Hydrogenase isoenzymes formation protein HypC [Methanococcus maripaludis]MBA2839887.1 hydrogenase expression/formation protein HypC [Methanococcus maripaludis]
MCLAIPSVVIDIFEEDGEKYALAEYKGVKQKAKLALIEGVEIGDYVLIHTGYALEKMSEDEAKLSLDAWEELFDVLDEMDGVKKENSE